MNPYDTYPNLWSSQYQGLVFVVKVPNGTEPLDEKVYKSLMEQRVVWMIQQWMELTNNTQLDTQQLLVRILTTLHSWQDHPTIDPDLSLLEWQQAWAETFIRFNHRFSELLSLQGIPFPVHSIPPSDPEHERLLDLHQETHLEEWLTALTP